MFSCVPQTRSNRASAPSPDRKPAAAETSQVSSVTEPECSGEAAGSGPPTSAGVEAASRVSTRSRGTDLKVTALLITLLHRVVLTTTILKLK